MDASTSHEVSQPERTSVCRLLVRFLVSTAHRDRITLLTILAALGAWKIIPALSTPQRAALIIPLLTFPVVYYLVSYEPRYRIPIAWILHLFAGTAVWELVRGPENADLALNN